MTAITVHPVETKRDLDDFIALPFRLHADDPAWVPPLWLERRMALGNEKRPYRQRAQVRLWLARRDGRTVGRISAQMDPLAQERDPGLGQFGLFAAENDPDIAARLTGCAEDWLRGLGMIRVRGPFGFSINEESGLLVDGFDTPPVLLMPHDLPYAQELLTGQGYAKAMDLYAYMLDSSAELSPQVAAVVNRTPPRGMTIRPLSMKRYDDEIRDLITIFNDAWSENWGFVPFTSGEVDDLAKELRPLIQERLVWFAELNGEPAAFMVCLPNLNEAIRDLNGRLLPFGWAKLLWRLKVRGLTSARIPLMGVRKKVSATMAGAMLPFLLIGALRQQVREIGIRQIELSWILETNPPMRRMAETLCGQPYKTYRLFEKDLA